MKKVQTRFAKSKYLAVSEFGTRFDLSFSSQLVFGNKIVALDGRKKCLLVLDAVNELSEPVVIYLTDVANVTMKKSYGSIKQGELKKKGIEEFLKRIDLQFEFRDKSETIILSCYESEIGDQIDRAKLVRDAKNWQMILSKMADSKPEKRGNEQLSNNFGLLNSRKLQ